MRNRMFAKRLVVVLAMAVACAAIIAAGTLAYFTTESTVENVITMGNVAMTLHEEKADGTPFPEDGVIGVMPGVAVDKIVYVENTGTGDFFLRIAVDESITPADGMSAELNCDNVKLDLNTSAWIEKDGFFYYNKVVAPGEKTEPIFTKVTFGKDMGNDYMGSNVVIHVDAQAVQSKNNGDDPLLAAGW